MSNLGRTSSLVDSPSHDEIERHIGLILSSPEFCQSRRCRQFLDYVARRALEGRDDMLKERSLGTDLFGRPQDWDPGDDTIVRVSAREVRRRLSQFYTTGKGSHEPLRIVLSPGSYVPEFHYVEPNAPPPAPVQVEAPPPPRRWPLALGLVGAVGLVAFFAWLRIPRSPAASEFFKPAWKAANPILIVMPTPVVYLPSQQIEALDRERAPKQTTPLQHRLLLPMNQLNPADFIPIEDQFVGFGDSISSSSLSAIALQHNHTTRVRLASKLEFPDLQETPAFLIGAFTNRWTLEFTKNLRFYFAYTPDNKAAIFDRQSSRYWTSPNRQDQSASEDYLLVCRLENSPTGKFVVIVAGLMQFGTEAAGRLIANPQELNVLLQRIGNIQGRNVEMVLHAKIIENSPSSAGLVAWQVWK